VEVWIEKDALVGVVEGSCSLWRVPLFSCRGYPSQSALYEAANRHTNYGVKSTVLHLTDHDPSGLNMTADIVHRFNVFGSDTVVRRIALTRLQVYEVNAPPNPAKLSDSRAAAYIARYGPQSWELDAMPPRVLSDLVAEEIVELIDHIRWGESTANESQNRRKLQGFCKELEDEE